MADEKETKPEGSEQITIRVRDQVRRWHDDDDDQEVVWY